MCFSTGHTLKYRHVTLPFTALEAIHNLFLLAFLLPVFSFTFASRIVHLKSKAHRKIFVALQNAPEP